MAERIFGAGLFDRRDDEAVYLDDFPRSIQLDSFSCGVQVMRSVLAYSECPVESFDMHWEHENVEGIDTPVIRDVLHGHGLRCRAFNDNESWGKMEGAIDRGSPVIVCLDDSEHWAVVFGYSDSYIYLMDPNPKKLLGCQIGIEEFAKRWDQWGLAVSRK